MAFRRALRRLHACQSLHAGTASVEGDELAGRRDRLDDLDQLGIADDEVALAEGLVA